MPGAVVTDLLDGSERILPDSFHGLVPEFPTRGILVQVFPSSCSTNFTFRFSPMRDCDAMLELAAQPHIAGLTTNPTLMRKAGITDYRAFALSVLSEIKEKPISFEVFSDDFREMERQAHEIASWGENVFVKIPVTNTRAESSAKLIRRLAGAGVKQNVTALMTLAQVAEVAPRWAATPAFISVFAGRIADTGRDPMPIMAAAVELLRPFHNQRLIWASPREVLNIFQADQIGCHVITVTHDLLKKLGELGKDFLNTPSRPCRCSTADAPGRAGFHLSRHRTAARAAGLSGHADKAHRSGFRDPVIEVDFRAMADPLTVSVVTPCLNPGKTSAADDRQRALAGLSAHRIPGDGRRFDRWNHRSAALVWRSPAMDFRAGSRTGGCDQQGICPHQWRHPRLAQRRRHLRAGRGAHGCSNFLAEHPEVAMVYGDADFIDAEGEAHRRLRISSHSIGTD